MPHVEPCVAVQINDAAARTLGSRFIGSLPHDPGYPAWEDFLTAAADEILTFGQRSFD